MHSKTQYSNISILQHPVSLIRLAAGIDPKIKFFDEIPIDPGRC